MDEMSTSRLTRRQNLKRNKRRRGCLRFLIIIFILLIGASVWGYFNFKMSVDKIHNDVSEKVETHESRENEVKLTRGDAFSVLLLGIDTGEYGRVDQGRSDSIMVMTVNPKDHRITITSIPRDTLVPIVGYGTNDKINHAYSFGGAAMSINTIQSYLDIPIDYYVAVNMAGIQQMVDTVGGITITPSATFSQGGYSFYEGQTIHMDGAMALEYSRMRKLDGDYARQNRQREVVMALISELASIENVMNYQSVLQTMEQNVITNMTFEEMVEVSLNYRSAAENIENNQLKGEGTMIEGVYYEIVPEDEVQRVSQLLKDELFID